MRYHPGGLPHAATTACTMPPGAGVLLVAGSPLRVAGVLPAIVSLLGAAAWGSGDFLGGLAAKSLRAVVVVAVSAAASGTMLFALYPVLGGAWSVDGVLWGMAAGMSNAVAVGLLYACLAAGPMCVLSPITAVVGGLVPVMWGLAFDGERLQVHGYLGLTLALVAIILISRPPGERFVRPALRSIVLAIGSGVAIGVFLICIDQAGSDSGVVPLIVNRIVGVLASGSVIVGLLVVAGRGHRRGWSVLTTSHPAGKHGTESPPASPGVESPPASPGVEGNGCAGRRWRPWALATVCGFANTTGNLLVLFALRVAEELAVVSVLGALYPVGTIILAAVVLGERVAATQWIGLSVALGAASLLAVP